MNKVLVVLLAVCAMFAGVSNAQDAYAWQAQDAESPIIFRYLGTASSQAATVTVAATALTFNDSGNANTITLGALTAAEVVAQINAAIAGDFGRDEAGAWGFTNVGGSIEVALRVRSQDWQSSAARQRAVLPR